MNSEIDIAPERFRSWLLRQGWLPSDREPRIWELVGPGELEPWAVAVVDLSEPNRPQRNRETIEALAHIYCCQQWEIEAVLKVEPIETSEAHGTIELFDQVERLDVGGGFVELTDHNPAQINVDDDGADLLIAAIVSARHGWGSSVETIGRGGGSFTLTIGKLPH